MAMVQQNTLGGGTTNTEDSGIQQVSEFPVQYSEAGCLLEGLEMPLNPSDITKAASAAAPLPETPMEGEAQGKETAQSQVGSMSEPNAWMQNTTAGVTPVITQDEILKAVGAYLDAADADGNIGPQAQRAAQTAALQKPDQPAARPEQAAVMPEQAAVMPETVQAKPDQAAEPVQANVSRKPDRDAAAEVQRPLRSAPENAKNAFKGAADTGSAKPQSDMSGKGEAQGKTEAGTAQKTIVSDMAGKTWNTAADKTDSAAPDSERHVTAGQDAPDEAMKTQTVGVQPAESRTAAPADTVPAKAPEAKAAEAPQYTKENVLRIVDKVSTRFADGKYDFDVELKPDFLGKLSIRLSMEDGSIRMQIKTDDASVKSMLSSQTSSLQDALKEKGITLSNVDITYESQTSLSGERQPFEQNNGGGRHNGAYFAQAEAAGLEPKTEMYSLYFGNSSVEFLA